MPDLQSYESRFSHAAPVDHLDRLIQSAPADDTSTSAERDRLIALRDRASHVKDLLKRLIFALQTFTKRHTEYDSELSAVEERIKEVLDKPLRQITVAEADLQAVSVGIHRTQLWWMSV
jgi:Mg2+ and Co2+ transporter CorA